MTLLRVSSVSDTVTNSSTEVFLIHTSDAIKKYLKIAEEDLEDEFTYVETLEDCRKLFKRAYDGEFLDELNYCIKNGYFVGADETRVHMEELCSQAKYTVLLEEGLTEDAIWDKYKVAYSCMQHTACGFIDDNYNSYSTPEYAIINGLKTVFGGGMCRTD